MFGSNGGTDIESLACIDHFRLKLHSHLGPILLNYFMQ